MATGGNPQSSLRAGLRGLPIVYAVIGGLPERFAPLVDLYRRGGEETGHASATNVTMGAIGLIGETSQGAKDAFFPYWMETMKYGAKARGWAIPSRSDYDLATRGAQSIFAGSADEVAERIISVSRLVGADRYAMQMDWAGVPQALVMKGIELLGTEVLPQVRKELEG